MFPQFSILGTFEIFTIANYGNPNLKSQCLFDMTFVDGWLGGGLHMSHERFYVKIIEMVNSIGYPMIQINGTCNQMQSSPIGPSTSSFCYIKQGVCHTVPLPFTLKSILRQKKELLKLKYFTMQRYNLSKIL
jgi:hypothetical protein